jgi:hypothetical protein
METLVPIRNRPEKKTIYVEPEIVKEVGNMFIIGDVEIQHSLYGCPVVKEKVVGYCLLHKANVSINQMNKKQCCEKECKHFKKYPNAVYWTRLERRREAKRNGKRNRKEREARFVEKVQKATEIRAYLEENLGFSGVRYADD